MRSIRKANEKIFNEWKNDELTRKASLVFDLDWHLDVDEDEDADGEMVLVLDALSEVALVLVHSSVEDLAILHQDSTSHRDSLDIHFDPLWI